MSEVIAPGFAFFAPTAILGRFSSRARIGKPMAWWAVLDFF
jgi:hypothetical protein